VAPLGIRQTDTLARLRPSVCLPGEQRQHAPEPAAGRDYVSLRLRSILPAVTHFSE